MICSSRSLTLLSYFLVLLSLTKAFSITDNVLRDLEKITEDDFRADVLLWQSDSTVSPLYTDCGGTYILGGYNVITGTQQLLRTYTSLPTHTSAQVIINFWFLDVWTNTNSVSLYILDGATTVVTKSIKVTNSAWPSDLCGASANDLAPVTISAKFAHSGDLGIKIKCSSFNSPTPGYCGLRDIKATLTTDITLATTFCAFASDISNIAQDSCTCATNQYFDIETGICESCDPACATCFGPASDECKTNSCSAGYTWKTPSTCYKCAPGCQACSGGAASDCISCESGKYMYPNSSCITGCGTPYSSTPSSNGLINYCNFPCTASNYLFAANFSCEPDCNPPYKERVEGLEKSCDMPCLTGSFYYPDGSCSSSCSDPMKDTGQIENVKYCENPCSDPDEFYYPTEDTCKADCTNPGDSTGLTYKLCDSTTTNPTDPTDTDPTDTDPTDTDPSDTGPTTPTNPTTPPEKGTLQTIKETTDSVLNAGLIIASLASMGDSFSIIDGTVSRMFQYIRYLDIGYSEELEMVLESWTNSLFSLKISSKAPVDLKDETMYKPLPDVFSKYQVAPSFLYNFWQDWIMIIIFFCVFACCAGLEYGLSRTKHQKPIFRTITYYLRVMSQQFVLMLAYTSFGDILFYSILEFRSTISGQNLSNLSLCISIFQVIIGFGIIGLQIKLIALKQKITGNKNTRPNPEALKEFSKKHAGCQVFFHDFKDESLGQQAFLLVFIGRTMLIILMLTTLFEYPLVECVLIVILNILMIMFLIWKKPFKEKVNEIQQLFSEGCLLLVNLAVLALAALDAQGREEFTTRRNLGILIIVLNTIFNFASLVFLAVMAFQFAQELYRERKKRKLNKAQPRVQTANQIQNENISIASADQDASTTTRLKRKTTRLEITESMDKIKRDSKHPETSQDLNLHISLEGPSLLTRGKSYVDLCVEDGGHTERNFQTSGGNSAYRNHKSRSIKMNQVKQEFPIPSTDRTLQGRETQRSLISQRKDFAVSSETDRSPSPEIRRTQTLADKLDSTSRSKYTDQSPMRFEYYRPVLQHSNTTEVLMRDANPPESPKFNQDNDNDDDNNNKHTRMEKKQKPRQVQLAKQTIVSYVSPTHVNKGTISIVNMKEGKDEKDIKDPIQSFGTVKPKLISSEKEKSLALASELERKLTLKSQESIKSIKSKKQREKSLANESKNSQNTSQSISQNTAEFSKKTTGKLDIDDLDDKSNSK